MKALNVQTLEATIIARIVATEGEPSARFSPEALVQFNAINDKLQELHARPVEELTAEEIDIIENSVANVDPWSITGLQVDGVIEPIADDFFQEVMAGLNNGVEQHAAGIAFSTSLIAKVVNVNTNFKLSLSPAV